MLTMPSRQSVVSAGKTMTTASGSGAPIVFMTEPATLVGVRVYVTTRSGTSSPFEHQHVIRQGLRPA